MIIQRLVLIGNKRLLNKGTRQIAYTPQSDLQLIIGQNGHGKSTLLEELSPLPAVPANYNKGGSKLIELEHNTHQYVLFSDFSKGSSHSFLKDNVELNPGGTITVQKTLVEQEFQYSTDLHELLMGRVRLTQLSAKARREWFVKLCEVDVSYATKVFAQLTQNSRNAVGALKHAQAKLASEITQLLDPEQHEELKAKTHQLMDESFKLSAAKVPGISFGDNDARELSAVQERLRVTSEKLLSLNHYFSGKTLSQLQQETEQAKLDEQLAIQNLSALNREYDNLESLVNQLAEAGSDSNESLLEELARLEQTVKGIKTYLKFDRLEDVEAAIGNAVAVMDSLDDVLMSLPVNRDAQEYTKQLLQETEQQRAELQLQLDRATNLIAHKESAMVEMRHGKDQTCPQCRYVWIPGFSETAYQQLQDEVKALLDKKAAIEPRLVTIDEWLTKAKEWRAAFAQYHQLTIAYPRLREFWDSLVEDYKLYNAPKSLVGALKRWLAELHKVREKTSIEARMALINAALEKRRVLSNDSTETLLLKRSGLEEQIYAANQLVNLKQAEYRQAKFQLDAAVQVNGYQEQLKRLEDAGVELLIRKTTDLQNRDLDQIGSDLRTQAGLLSSRLQQSNAVIQIVDHLTRSIEELERDLELYQILIEELSPSTGLIADTLIGFINAFTSQMNGVLSKIWSTPLAILPCDISNGELNYRFPVTTIDPNEPISDVSEGSTGEKEVIDFAFRLIAMLYLKIEHYPLLLDEVGASFHELNRNSLFNYVKLLVECKRVSQVFVVSHFAQTHGSLTHADVNIIDPTGIMVTPTANRNFIIQ